MQTSNLSQQRSLRLAAPVFYVAARDSIVLGVFSPLRDKRLPRGAFTRLEHLAPVSLWLPLALFARVGSTRDIYSVCPIMPRCPCTVGDLAHGNVSQQRIGLTLNFK